MNRRRVAGAGRPPVRAEKCVKHAAKRNRLAELLVEAAEFEHDVLCQYLFAAFSMKKYGDPGVSFRQLEMMRQWEAHILKIARQEMEHLALANNLLTAIGEAPYFRRPSYPVRPRHYPPRVPSSLDRLSLDSILRFVLFEMPEQLKDPRNLAYLQSQIPGFEPSAHHSVAHLYDEIQSLFDAIDPECLFVGPRSSQFTTTEIIPIPIRGLYLLGNTTQAPKPYDVSLIPVTNKTSADQAIAQIIEEGEGTDDDDPNSHFHMFLQMHQQYRAELDTHPDFDPARPVVSNPTYRGATPGRVSTKHTVITNKRTIRVSRLFDQVYATMMLMLTRYFSHTDESLAELAGLQQAVFFPLMTAVVRPLAEVLTQLPVSSDPARGTAGPTFLFGRDLALLPHREAAWRVLHMQLAEMAALADELRSSPAYPAPIRDRLTLVYENLARIEMNFDGAMNVGSDA